MKRTAVLMSLFCFFLLTFARPQMLNSGDFSAQAQQKVLQQKRVLPALKTRVTSVTPQKAVLTRGGDAVVVEAKGTNLTAIGSVQVTRAGSEAQGIEETLDRSQLPTALKVSLKASAQAPIANDYRLSVFDAGNKKLLDVPTTVLAIEVVAPTTKPLAMTTSRKPQQRVTQQRDQVAASRFDVASISPQKAVLIQGGDPVAVEAKGAKLDMVASARVTRAGTPVPEIEASIDPSRLPTSLKVNLKASSQAQVGKDYQLTVFDTNRRKILDVPSSALAIEVKAPVQISQSLRTPSKLADKRFRTAQTLGGKPDLIVTNISLTTDQYGQAVVEIWYKNQGNADAVFANWETYLKVNLDGPQHKEYTAQTQNYGMTLTPGRSTNCIPKFWADPGEYVVTCTVDPNGLIDESDETNNTLTANGTVGPRPVIEPTYPDLVITSMTITPTSGPANSVFKLDVTVKNQGQGAINLGSNNVFEIVSCPLWDLHFNLGSSGQIKHLGSGETQTYSYSYRVSQPGTHTVTCIADPKGTIQEEDENNNTASVVITVVGS